MPKFVAEKYSQTGKFNKTQLREAHFPRKGQGDPQTPKPKNPHPGTP